MIEFVVHTTLIVTGEHSNVTQCTVQVLYRLWSFSEMDILFYRKLAADVVSYLQLPSRRITSTVPSTESW